MLWLNTVHIWYISCQTQKFLFLFLIKNVFKASSKLLYKWMTADYIQAHLEQSEGKPSPMKEQVNDSARTHSGVFIKSSNTISIAHR